MHLAASLIKKTETSAFIARRVAAKDLFGKKRKSSTNSACYLTTTPMNSDQFPGHVKSGVALSLPGRGYFKFSFSSLPSKFHSVLYLFPLSFGGVGKGHFFFLFFEFPRLRED